MAAMHRHDWRPRAIDRKRILFSCRGCSRRNWRNAEACPNCDELARAHQAAILARGEILMAMTPAERAHAIGVAPYVPGCDRDDCHRGLLIAGSKSGCCCYGLAETKCVNCARVPDRPLIHVCLRETPEEIDHALTLALAPPAPRLGEEKAA